MLTLCIALFLFSCDSSSEDEETASGDDTITNNPVTCSSSDWTDATHSKSAYPDYTVVFPNDSVLTLKLTISSSDWLDMLDDMTGLYGDFGSTSSSGGGGDMGGGPGGGGPGGPGGEPGGGGMTTTDENPIWKPCNVEFNGIQWCYVGVRFKGNSSLRDTWQNGLYKLPMRLDFDEFEDDYPEIDNQRFYGFKKLSLSSNYHDDTFIREKVVADIFREAGVPAPRTSFCRLYIDTGEGSVYFGLYTLIEIPDDPMLESQFSDDDGNLYKPDGDSASFAQTYNGSSFSSDYIETFDKETNEDDADYSDILALYDALHSDRTDAAAWRSSLEATLDVDGFLQWLAINTVIQNWDTYGKMTHNFYLYNDSSDNLLHWIPWDNNESMSSDKATLSLDLTSSEVSDSWPLIRYLIDDDVYNAAYVAYIKDFVDTTKDYAYYPDRIKPLFSTYHELVREYTVGDNGEIEGYTFLSSDDAFDDGLDELYDHVDSRYQAAVDFVSENE